MKYLLPIFFFSLLFMACQDEDAPMDTETNKYYADYVAIYNAYDSLGNEATLKALDDYLVEFPEQLEAYVFKAFVLGKMGKVDEAYKFFGQARDMDSLAVESYEYQSSFMLFDSTQHAAAAELIAQGLLVEDSSGLLMNNRAWLKLLDGDLEGGFMDITEGVKKSPKTKDLYRTGFIVSSLLELDSPKLYYSSKLDQLGIDSPDSLEAQLMNEGVNQVLNSLF